MLNEERILDFYALGGTFAGPIAIIVIIAVVGALSRASLWRAALWLMVVAEGCLLLGVVIFNVFIWRAVVENNGFLWMEVVSLVLLAAGVASGVIGLIALLRELARRGATGWMMLCAVALLVFVGADAALTSSTLLQIFDLSFLREMLSSHSTERAYYGVVSALLVCALLPALVSFRRVNRQQVTQAPVAQAGE